MSSVTPLTTSSRDMISHGIFSVKRGASRRNGRSLANGRSDAAHNQPSDRHIRVSATGAIAQLDGALYM